MPLFSVQYVYRDDDATAQGRQDLGPGHLEFVRHLEATGALLLAGKWAPESGQGGQFLLSGESEESVRALFGSDPYVGAGFVDEMRVHQWNASLGSLAPEVADRAM